MCIRDREITARNIRIMSTLLTTFAVVIAVGVVYNNARIALAERGWELASLRVLGFTRAEVSTLLLGELAIVIALALPLGMLAGNGPVSYTHLDVYKRQAYDMRGAFNRIAIKRAPGAAETAVIAEVERAIAPWGGREAHGREDQTSHAMLDNEIREQQVLGTVLPSIFLAVAAFLLNVVVSRLVATQREQIAALKALGYPNRSIGGYYLRLVLAIVTTGLLLSLIHI